MKKFILMSTLLILFFSFNGFAQEAPQKEKPKTELKEMKEEKENKKDQNKKDQKKKDNKDKIKASSNVELKGSMIKLN